MLKIRSAADASVYIAGENHRPSGRTKFPDRKHGMPRDPHDVPAMLDQTLIDRIVRTARAISPALDIEGGARLLREDVSRFADSP
jgi:hypothetical protein